MTVRAGEAPPQDHVGTRRKKRGAWTVIVVLIVVAVLNYLDRLLPGTLAEPIRKDLALSDTGLGLINGYGFLIVYALAGIPIARLADRGRFTLVISLSLGLWSCMTALGSLTRDGWQFGLTRLGVAVGEAGSAPATHAFITRSFSADVRARALSIWALSGPLGTMGGLMIGGYVGSVLGWRNTFALMGLIGLVLTPIVWRLLDRHAPPPVSSGRPAQTGPHRWTELFRTRSGTMIVLAASMVSAGIYANASFNPAFLIRVHGLTIAQAGVQLGLTAGIGGIAVVIATGWMGDLLGRKDPRWTLGVLAGAMLAGAPLLIAAYLVENTALSIVLLGLGAACINAYIPLTVLALYRLVSPEVRARTSATLLFATACFGGLGPLLVGLTSDALAASSGNLALRYAMLVVPILALIGASLYGAASLFYRSDIARSSAI